MRSKISLLLLITLCLLAFSGQVFGAKFLIVAPGQTWTNGVGITGSLTNQVAGVPFNVSVVAVSDATTAAFDSSGFSVTMTCNALSTITPANTFQLTQNLSGTPNALRYPVAVTLGTAVAGPVVLAANPNGAGPTFGSVTITSQVINSFSFDTISSPKTAGQSFYISVTARTSTNAVVTGFNGTATLTANYPVIGSVTVGTIQFTNGSYYGNITLYDATQANLTLTCTSTTPAASGTSGAFSVSAGTLDRLVIIGPGQTFAPGTNGGNGRVSGSTSVSQQTAGTYFYVTVYAVDAYFNTSTTSATITMSTTDPNYVFTPASTATSGAPNAGRAIFRVELRTVGSGSQTLTATAPGITAGQDTVPMTYGTLDHFIYSQNITSKTAGQLFQVNAVAVDAYNNTVTTFASAPTVSFYTGAVALDSGHTSNTTPIFAGGVGTFYASIFQRVLNASIRLTYSTAVGNSNLFDVAPSDFTKLLFVAPGQTYDPGDNNNGGVMNNPNQATAGSAIAIDVYATDDWGNKIGTINDVVSLTTSDALATINGVTPPATVNLSNGQATYNIIFRTGGTNTVSGTDITTSGVSDAGVSIVVQATGLSYFEIANVPSSRTSGQAFSPIIRAKDQYGNNKTDYAGIVYLSANTDYTLPFESTMAISGANAGAYYHKWAVTFTAGDLGERQLTGYYYRATTTAQMFASDVFNDTPASHTGHYGTSSSCTVNSGSAFKLQVLPPGMEARPGTLDGENNTPSGQAISTAFTNTVNIVDTWWNVVAGRTDQINVTTTDPANSQINGTSSLPVAIFLVDGTKTFTSAYSNQSSAFQLRVDNASVPSITNDFSPNISIYNIFNFSIKAPGGVLPIGNQTAGSQFSIQITAFSAFGVTATGFNSTVEISANTDYNASEYTISPTRSITFTAGVAVMPITMYRARTSAVDGSGAVIYVKFGTKQGQSSDFDLSWGPVTSVLVLADGMTHKPGLKHVGIPGYKGYDGAPKTVESGYGSQLDVLYVDDNYNRVYDNPLTFAKLTSTDAIASVDGISLATNNVYVTITAGAFNTANGMVLRRVGTTGQQYITAEPGGAIPNNTTPPINIRHTTFSHFGVSAPGSTVIAGVPFNITLQALDLHQNICDDLNGGTPFNSTANLSASTGANTMWPVTYPLSRGEAVASVQLFQAPDTNAHITAEYSALSGTSDAIITAPNEFKRLLVTTTGMSRKNGVYTAAPPTQFTMYDTTRPPFWPSNQATVNDAAHTPSGYQFTVYACDAYGNITATADVLGQTITVGTNDQYALPVTLTAISSVTGQVIVDMVFHRASAGIFVGASISNAQIESFTTPTFTTLAGTPYGLQVQVPGLTQDNGAGYFDGSVWYNGMTGTPQTQLSGVPFVVTIQASDIYGNFTNSVTDQVRLISSSSTSFPGLGTIPSPAFTGNLGQPDSGISTLTAQMVVGAPTNVQLTPFDLTDGTMNKTWMSYPNIFVTNGGNLEYRVLASPNTYTAYTAYGDSTNSITAVAAPDKFAFRVNVVDSVSEQPVYGATNNFACTPVGYPDFNTVLGGTLGIQSGTSTNGVFASGNQSYTNATSFRIRVSDLNPIPANRLTTAYSPIIIMGANPNAVTLTVGVRNNGEFYTDIFNARASVRTVITGNLIDGNGNNLNGPVVSFRVMSGSGRFAGNNITATAATANGDAVVDFYGAFTNENNIIRASYNGYYDYVTVAVSIVDPVLGQVSNYPNPFRAGAENTSISYLLDANADVKIKVYTLFGDLVYSKDIKSGDPGAVGGIVNNYLWDGKNNKGEVIGNGGYICVVETTIEGEKRKMIRKIAVSK